MLLLTGSYDLPEWWGSDKPYRITDWMEGLKSLPDGVVDCVVTSPPYWALRDYGVDGQLGLEDTFEGYIDSLCSGFDEVKRVLKDSGTCWVNLGDTYSGSWGAFGHRPEKTGIEGHQREKKTVWLKRQGHPDKKRPPTSNSNKIGIPAKSLVMIPFRFAIEMVNRGWILRNTVIWHKNSCMPSSAKDRFTVDFEYLFFFTKCQQYNFEQQFEPCVDYEVIRRRKEKANGLKSTYHLKCDGQKHAPSQSSGCRQAEKKAEYAEQGKNKRAVWTINPMPYSDAHFATYPPELIETPIKSGCPKFICNRCGQPRKKIYEKGEPDEDWKKACGADSTGGYSGEGEKDYDSAMAENPSDVKRRILEGLRSRTFMGWTDCGCDEGFSPGIVLDPFLGSGTTVVTAMNLGRIGLGFELNKDYGELIKERIRYRNRKKVSRPHVKKAKEDVKQTKLGC